MSDIDKTVFISYRRSVSRYSARAVFMDLRAHGYDVFMDVESIDSGYFETIILNQIASRKHFLVILTPGTIERFIEPNDWMKREIEHAIDLNRNIVPVFVDDFSFGDPAVKEFLVGHLQNLTRYNGVSLHHDYFNEGMEKLRARFLKTPRGVEVKPVSPAEQMIVDQMIDDISQENGGSRDLLASNESVNTWSGPAYPSIDLSASAPEKSRTPYDIQAKGSPGSAGCIKELAIIFSTPVSWLIGSLISYFVLDLLPVSTLAAFGLVGGATSTLLITWLGLSVTGTAYRLQAMQLIRISTYFLFAGLIPGFVGEALWFLICNVSTLDQLIGCNDLTSISWKLAVGFSSLLSLAGANAIMLLEFGGTRLVKRRG